MDSRLPRGTPPMGIALLAVWSLVVGAAVLGLTLFAIYGLGTIPRALVAFLEFPEGLVLIAAGVFAAELVTAIGLWTLREWGRLLGIVFATISFGTGMLTLPLGFVGVLFSVATVWYLTEKKTRSLFRAGRRPPPPS